MIDWIFAQAGKHLPAADSTLDAATRPIVEITLFDLILKGGWAMVPLGMLLVGAIYIFVERYLTIKKSNSDPEPFFRQIREMVRAGHVTQAFNICQSTNSPYARMVAKGIKRLGSPLTDITVNIENEGKLEINRLERSLSLLATIAGAAPMLGFLGTVTGLIQGFMTISQFEGNVNPAALSGGIYEAMITTAAGLIIGIPAYVGYNYLTSLISDVIFKMEIITTDFIDLLQEPA